MLTDRSIIAIIHRFSNFLIQTSKSKLDQTHFPNSPVRYDMNLYQGGIGLGIFAVDIDRSATGCCKSVVVNRCTRNGDQMMKMNWCSVFSLRVEDDNVEAFTDIEFLTFCNLCRTKLSGEDIYMYRGEKAFCSEECRDVQIAKEERIEDYRYLSVSKLAVVGANSSPPSASVQMMSTGIFAI